MTMLGGMGGQTLGEHRIKTNLVGAFNPFEKSARTVGAKGRVFPEALTQSALAGGGGGHFFCR